MKAVLNVEQARKADTYAISELMVPEIVLMENAANYAATIINNNVKAKLINKIIANQNLDLNPENKLKVLIICGTGNNGGDGFALARLMLSDYNVECMLLGSINKMSKSTNINYNILSKLKVNIIHNTEDNIEYNKYDIIVDTLIGVGFKGKLRENVSMVLEEINKSRAYKVAIDVPTGLNADTGESDENAFIADCTITMFAEKLGFYLNKESTFGEIFTADLGLPKKYPNQFANNFIIEEQDVNKYLYKRISNTSKFDYGKLAIIAGSNKYSGAAALTANAAIKAGAGLVYLFSINAHSSLLPEVIFEKLEQKNGAISDNNYELLLDNLSNMNAIVIGPGIGKNDFTLSLIERIIKNIPKNIPVLIDADALNVVNKVGKLRGNIIITPHLGEFAEIIGKNRNEINRYNDCKTIANELNCTVLLKGHNTLISDGEITYINANGNPGMATAGSGDVLSGIIGALLSQGIETTNAGAIGAYLHGKAGDLYAKKYNQMSLSASDIINEMKNIIQKSND